MSDLAIKTRWSKSPNEFYFVYKETLWSKGISDIYDIAKFVTIGVEPFTGLFSRLQTQLYEEVKHLRGVSLEVIPIYSDYKDRILTIHIESLPPLFSVNDRAKLLFDEHLIVREFAKLYFC